MKIKPSTTKPDSDLAAWCEMLAMPSTTAEPVPKGWFTVVQLAAQWGKSECTTGERVRRLLNKGKVKRQDFVIQLNQVVRRTPHYRLK